MYARTPDESELAGLGLSLADFGDDTVEVWEENEPAISLFGSISTQWRAGPGGPIGLDYGVMFYRMDRMGLTAGEHEQLFQDMRIVESEALSEMNTRDEK